MRALRLPVFSRLILSAIALSIPAACMAGFDLSKLDSRIDLVLNDSSMADAVFAIAQTSRIDVAAPAEPNDGLTASLKRESLREVLNTLAKMTGLSWHIENTVVVFKKPAAPPQAPPVKEDLTPDEGMTALLASLDEEQLYYISRGIPLLYSDLTPAQQEIIASMLGPSNSGVTGSGVAIPALPKPEEVAIAFRVIPLIVIPKTSGGQGWTFRLDSMPYAILTGKAR